MILSPDTSTSKTVTVDGTSQQFDLDMGANEFWMFVSATACYIAQGANPTASAADGSVYVPANVIIPINGRAGAKLAVIQAASGGLASLTRVLRF